MKRINIVVAFAFCLAILYFTQTTDTRSSSHAVCHRRHRRRGHDGSAVESETVVDAVSFVVPIAA